MVIVAKPSYDLVGQAPAVQVPDGEEFRGRLAGLYFVSRIFSLGSYPSDVLAGSAWARGGGKNANYARWLPDRISAEMPRSTGHTKAGAAPQLGTLGRGDCSGGTNGCGQQSAEVEAGCRIFASRTRPSRCIHPSSASIGAHLNSLVGQKPRCLVPCAREDPSPFNLVKWFISSDWLFSPSQ